MVKDLHPHAGECESPCHCKITDHQCSLTVLTGGPGAGKTAVLEAARKVLCRHVVILPESAGIIFGGGFWRLESTSARNAAQGAIFHIQRQMEELVLNENKWALGLCDRGTLDGLAYWADDKKSYFEYFKTSVQEEYKRYKSVIHLRTPATENGYNNSNPIRVETAEEAKAIDNKIHDVWKDHPNYTQIESTDSFMEKVIQAFKQIEGIVPECCKGGKRKK